MTTACLFLPPGNLTSVSLCHLLPLVTLKICHTGHTGTSCMMRTESYPVMNQEQQIADNSGMIISCAVL